MANIKDNTASSIFTLEMVRRQLADSSRALADLTASMVYDNPTLLESLIEVAYGDSDPWSQRASRIVSICCCSYPELFKPYCNEVIGNLDKLISEGSRRNFMKILAETDVKLTKKNKSVLINLCFQYMYENYSVAVKVYSMQILYNLSLEIPEVGIELSNLLEEELPDATPGYRAAGRRSSENYSVIISGMKDSSIQVIAVPAKHPHFLQHNPDQKI